jgi:hypothetical protein
VRSLAAPLLLSRCLLWRMPLLMTLALPLLLLRRRRQPLQ